MEQKEYKTERLGEIIVRGEGFASGLLSSIPCPVFAVSPDTTIKYVNPALEKMTGFTSSEIIGRKVPYPWWVGHHDAREFQEALRLGLGKSEKRFRKKSGEWFWVEATSVRAECEGECYHIVTWTDITALKQLNDNMEFYLTAITRAQETERKRVAHELLDGLVQSLSALSLDIDELASHDGVLPEGMVPRLQQLREKGRAVADEARRYSYELHPGVFDYLGVVEAMEILIDDTNDAGIAADLVVSGSERPLPHDQQMCLFRIAQAALDNVKKHAQATTACVRIRFNPNKVLMEITDNGQGFVPPEPLNELARQGKLSLIAMKERSRICGGLFSMKSQPGKGTKVTVEIPTAVS